MQIPDLPLRCREDEPHALPVRDFRFRLVRHHRQLAAFPDRVAKAPHESDVDVATLPAWLRVELAHEEQIASSARRKLIPEPFLIEEHVMERLELATIRVQHMVEGLAQLEASPTWMRATRAFAITALSAPSPAVTRTSNQVTNPSSTSGSPKDNSVSTITRNTTDALAIARACQR